RDGEILEISLVTSSGLRNVDGAVMLQSAGGTILDAVVYGGPAPSPYDAPEAWLGAPLASPGPGLSLCRIDPQIDSDGADDWIPCAPSPGSVDAHAPIEGDTTTTAGEDDTTTTEVPDD